MLYFATFILLQLGCLGPYNKFYESFHILLFKKYMYPRNKRNICVLRFFNVQLKNGLLGSLTEKFDCYRLKFEGVYDSQIGNKNSSIAI